MIRSIESLCDAAKARAKQCLAAACAQDDQVLLAVENARSSNIADAILIGDEAQIRRVAAESGIDPSNYRIIDVPDKVEACRTAGFAC